MGWGTAAAYHPARQFPANVTVRLNADGMALVRCGFHEMGMGAATAAGSDRCRRPRPPPFEAVTVQYGETDLLTGPGAGGSCQTASVAQSLMAACEKLKKSIGRPSARTPRLGKIVGPGEIHGQVPQGSTALAEVGVRRAVLQGTRRLRPGRAAGVSLDGCLRRRPSDQREDDREPGARRHHQWAWASPSRRRPSSTRAQGQYMGYLRGLKPRQKARVKALRAAKGVRPAIAFARRLANR